jgi:hypothetical protein
MFSKVWRAGISPIGYYLKASLFFSASFLVGCLVVPVIDIFMLAFDVVAYFFTAKEGEDSNPLNHQFINFLLQYRTLRVPMEVLMQSLPQSVVAVGAPGRTRSTKPRPGSS